MTTIRIRGEEDPDVVAQLAEEIFQMRLGLGA